MAWAGIVTLIGRSHGARRAFRFSTLRSASAAILLCLATAHAATSHFDAAIGPIPPAARAKMEGVSWKPGCPVGPDDLASIRLTYWGFDNAAHSGVIVVHRDLAAETVAIFRELFQARFAIARMQPYEDFAVGKYAEANDTVGFYCRPDQGDPTKLGMHSYGYAIDINPLINPYRDAKEGWWPTGSADNSGRDRDAPGIVTAHGKVFAIFARHGWVWGGLYRDDPDYMHFEKGTIGAHPDPRDAPYAITGLRYQGK